MAVTASIPANIFDLWFKQQQDKDIKILVCIWPALRKPVERLASSRLENREIQTPTRLHKDTPSMTGRVENTLSVWKGQGVWINSDRAIGIWTQMVHNLPSPLNYAVWLALSFLAKITAKHSFRPSYTQLIASVHIVHIPVTLWTTRVFLNNKIKK